MFPKVGNTAPGEGFGMNLQMMIEWSRVGEVEGSLCSPEEDRILRVLSNSLSFFLCERQEQYFPRSQWVN